MRDVKLVVGGGPKQFVSDKDGLDVMLALVRAAYPGAVREGSCACWSWTMPRDDEILAEAWPCRSTKRRGWWLRIKPVKPKA